MKRLILLALTCCALSAQTREKRIVPVEVGQRNSFQRQGKVAVLVGVGDYPRTSGLSTLRYPSSDVTSVEAALEAQNYTVVSLQDAQATKGGVLQALRNAGEVMERGQGTLVFFFSGHGFEVGGKNYLATYGSNALNLSQTGLALDDVERAMIDTGVARRVMWVDACRNTPGKSADQARTFAAFQAAAGTRILFSTKAGRVSYENDDLRQGVFTHFLLEGLRGQAAGADGLVTFRDLADYVEGSVPSYSLQRGQVQVPYDAGEAAGDFLIARAGAGKVDVEIDRQPPMAAGGTLVVSCDSGCSVSVDGEAAGTLQANAAKRIPAEPGKHIVLGTSSENASLVKRQLVEVKGQQEAVLLEFGPDLDRMHAQAEAARAEALRRELEGAWNQLLEYDANFTDGDKSPYHSKEERYLQISSVSGGFRGVWRETRTIRNVGKTGGFTRHFEATFVLTRNGSQVSGYAESARMRDDEAAWADLGGVTFTGTVSGSGLAYKIIWTRDSGGNELSSGTGTLTR
jgi:hypothetical protein